MIKSVYNIREDEVKIEGKPWDHEDTHGLVTKKILQYENMLEQDRFYFNRGNRLGGMYEGNILTSAQKQQYEVEEKIVIEPPIMKAPLNALVGQSIKSRRSGQIITEGGSWDEENPSTDELDNVNVLMKDLEIKTGEKYKLREAIRRTHIYCYPACMYYDKRHPDTLGKGKLNLKLLPWNSVMYGPVTAQEPDGSDITEMMWFEPRTQADLELNFPNMKKQIRAHINDNKDIDRTLLSSLVQFEGNYSAEYADRIFDIVDNAVSSLNAPNGYIPTVQHLFPIRRKEEVWLHKFDDSKFEVRPADWTDERWQQWTDANQDMYFGPIERTSVVLWCTVFTLTGLVLSNKKHWFQENGKLPASFWIADVVNCRYSGLTKDMADDCLGNCISEIEHLDEIRKGSGSFFAITEGAVTNAEDLPSEVCKSTGFAFINKDFQGGPEAAIKEYKRQPNDVWRTNKFDRQESMVNVTRLNETMQGDSAPRQAAVAKEMEIAQSLIVNAIYMDNANRCWEFHQDLKAILLAYGYDEWDVIEVVDEETGDTLKSEINKPTEWDAEGNVTKVQNDLTSHRYRWKLNPVDDSPTAKIRTMQEALLVINAAAGPLLSKDPSGKMFARFLMAMDNDFLKKAGREMAEDAKMSSEQQGKMQEQESLRAALIEMAKAKAELLKAEKQGVNLSFKAEDLMNYPKAYEFYNQLQQMFNISAEQKLNNGAGNQQPQQPQVQQQPPQGGDVPLPEGQGIEQPEMALSSQGMADAMMAG